MSTPTLKLAADDIGRLAGEAGITLTTEWRDDMVEGSVFVVWARQRLRLFCETSGGRDEVGARQCPPS